MRWSKLFIISLLCGGLLFAKTTNSDVAAEEKQPININFKNLKISDLIKITAEILNKNLLQTESINGEVDFVSNKEIYKENLLDILIHVLEAKGYTVIENNEILKIVKVNDSATSNLPVLSNNDELKYFQMVTSVFTVDFVNVDYISSKIRHLISRSANLVTDKDSNAIVITDFSSNINTIRQVINILAQDAKKHIVNHTLKNAKAVTLAAELKNIAKSVFNETIEKEKVDILANKDTNSLMLIGKKENVEFLEKEVLRIDAQSSLVERIVDVVRLKNIEAKMTITVLNSIIDKRQYVDPNMKPFASIDEESNSIVMMGPKDEVKYIKELIEKLDINKQQVYVQARIIEVSETGTLNMGIKYGIEGLKSGAAGAFTFAGNLGGASVALSPATLSQVSLPKVSDGLVLGASINLLKQNKALDVVSEPSILCINNKESSIYVGETRTISTGTTTTSSTGTSTSTYKREDIGLKLKVKPRISSGDKVTLDITTVMEDVKETDSSTGQPNTSKKEVTTTAIVNDGESVILGGLIKNKKEQTVDKVPFLGDIPLIGSLFRNTNTLDDKINLVIIVTPYIIPQSKDLTYIRNQLSELKILEDKYTKDVAIRLESKRIKAGYENLQREEQFLKMRDDKKSILEDIEDFVEDEIDDKIDDGKLDENTTEEETSQISTKRIQEIYGNN